MSRLRIVSEKVEKERNLKWSPMITVPCRQHHSATKSVVPPWQIPKAPPPYNITGAPRQRNMPQMKEQIKTPEKELSNEEIDNPSDGEFKTLVIRMLTELVEYGPKIAEEVKAMESEIKENAQGTNSEGKETGTRINDLEQKEEINIKPEQSEETRIQKK